ncbi:hypothetical protein [Bifidobacterium sp.]|jgi:hypothetical protein|uniref:hypothetical protein n=1 Tax=Bifidobacterium sp. TaxID=41200 RepID=UPI0025BC988F|nr:hypothetical protein [Bifidobacterium sp.]MCH4209045.1 hypothetical protein [Bifidobacterium sp.]
MASGIVEYAIKPWRRNPADGAALRGRALVMPGTGYTCDRPLLYWAAQMLVQAGWHVDRLDVHNTRHDLSQVTPVIETAINEWHDSAVAQAADAGLPRPRMLLIGKSLTTLAYAHACELGVPMVLLTPVLNPAPFDPSGQRIVAPGEGAATAASAGATEPLHASQAQDVADQRHTDGARTDVQARSLSRTPLICAGTADQYYNAARAHALTDEVREYPAANHSIEVPGDWRRSVGYLADAVGSIERYAASL